MAKRLLLADGVPIRRSQARAAEQAGKPISTLIQRRDRAVPEPRQTRRAAERRAMAEALIAGGAP